MRHAAGLLLALLVAGCSYTVDDGKWTYRWRWEGRELRSEVRRWSESCGDGVQDEVLLGSLRLARLAACDRACASGAPEAKEACVLRCDAHIALVSARCEPATHRETWNPPLFAR